MEHIKQDQIINIPNTLTVIRILLLPVVVWRFVVGDATGALIAYLAAMLTDALDGIRNTDPRAGSTVHGNSRNY